MFYKLTLATMEFLFPSCNSEFLQVKRSEDLDLIPSPNLNFYTEKDELEEETLEIKYTDLYGQGEINMSVCIRTKRLMTFT